MPSTKKLRWWVVYSVSRVTKINVEEQEQHSCGTNKRRRCAGAGSTCKLWLPVNIGQVNITPRHTTGLATFKYQRQTFILYVCLWNGLTNLTSLGHYGPSRVNSRQNNAIAGSTTSYFIYSFTANILITTLTWCLLDLCDWSQRLKPTLGLPSGLCRFNSFLPGAEHYYLIL